MTIGNTISYYRKKLGITQFAPESLGHYVFESLREK